MPVRCQRRALRHYLHHKLVTHVLCVLHVFAYWQVKRRSQRLRTEAADATESALTAADALVVEYAKCNSSGAQPQAELVATTVAAFADQTATDSASSSSSNARPQGLTAPEVHVSDGYESTVISDVDLGVRMRAIDADSSSSDATGARNSSSSGSGWRVLRWLRGKPRDQ
jgi:hypothetical protein